MERAYATRKVSAEKPEQPAEQPLRYDLMVQAFGVPLQEQPDALKPFLEDFK